MLSEAENRIGAGPGDEVVIEGAAAGQVASGLALYILPLALFVVGFVAASALAAPLGRSAAEGVGVAGGVGFMGAYYGAVALHHRAVAGRRPAMRVVSVVRRRGA